MVLSLKRLQAGDGFMYIGVDLGGTNIKIGLLNEDLTVQTKLKVATESETNSETVMSNLITGVKQLLIKMQTGTDQIKAIGIGVPGQMDIKAGLSIFSPNFSHWDNVPVIQLIEDEFHVPTFMDNDVRVNLYGEWKLGAGKGKQDVLMVTLGTGLGAAMITNGRMMYGKSNSAAELGHLNMYRHGRPCACGSSGCLGRYVSARGMVKTVKTTVTNNEPDGVTLGHDTTGTDTNGNPTTGTTGETVTTPDGTRTYFKTQVTGGVSTPADGYYVTTTTTDVDGGQTKTTVDGSGAVTQVDKTWPDGDQTVVVIDKTGNAVFTETPNGQPGLPSQTVTPGGTATIGGTTLVNNEPTGGIQLTHQTTGSTIVETVDHGGSVNVVVTPNNNGGDNSISTDTGAGTGTGTTTPETPTNGGDNTTTGVDKGTGTETESTHGQTTTGGSSTGSTGSTGVVNTTVAQGQAVSGKQATVAGTNSHVSDQTQQADAQGKLPQTNENESAAGATIGLSLLGLLAALGFKRKKRDDE